MNNFFVAITAYDRPQRLQRLMVQLKQQRGVRTDTHVFYDDPDPPSAIKGSARSGGRLHTPKRHLGKKGYWRLVNYAIFEAEKAMKNEPWDYFLFLQDDISIDDPNLLREAGEIVDEIREDVPRVATFNLYGDGPHWNPVARWTGRPIVQMIHGWIYASWVDMNAVVFTPQAIEAVPRLHEPTPASEREGDSSGVGRQFSMRFDAERMAQIMAPEPVVEHDDGGRSKMHPTRKSETSRIQPAD